VVEEPFVETIKKEFEIDEEKDRCDERWRIAVVQEDI